MSEWIEPKPSATGQSASHEYEDQQDVWAWDIQSIPPLEDEQDEEGTWNTFQPLEDDVDNSPEPPSSHWAMLLRLGHRLFPILAPLALGGLTFLFTFLISLALRNPLGNGTFWALALIFLAIAIIQGTALYYASGNNGLWSLSMVIGFALFLLTGCYVLFGPTVSFIFLIVLLVLSVVTARLYMRIVPEGFVSIVISLGKYSRTLQPGLHFLWPWERARSMLTTRATQWVCPQQTVHISPDEVLHMAASISYQLMPEDAHLAVLYVTDWETSLQNLLSDTLQLMAQELSPQDFIPWSQGLYSRQENALPLSQGGNTSAHWEWLNEVLAQRMQEKVAPWGVQVNWVHIRDLTPEPRTPSRPDPVGPIGPTAQPSSRPRPLEPPESKQPSPQPSAAKQPAPAAHAHAGSAAAAPSSPVESKYGSLVKAYEAVRNKTIRDAATIRILAQRFEDIAKDPEASKHVSFDASRAAETLYQRAQILEKQERTSESYSRAYEPEVHAEWPPSRPADDNIRGGG